jgi:hypothetical protein
MKFVAPSSHRKPSLEYFSIFFDLRAGAAESLRQYGRQYGGLVKIARTR